VGVAIAHDLDPDRQADAAHSLTESLLVGF
jgi:hypothetical protein